MGISGRVLLKNKKNLSCAFSVSHRHMLENQKIKHSFEKQGEELIYKDTFRLEVESF
jgi:hypothetical protein